MVQRISAFLLLICGLAGCASDTPYLDSKSGQALQEGVSAQTIVTSTAPVENQMYARELRKSIDSYLTGGAATPALQGVSSQGNSSTAR